MFKILGVSFKENTMIPRLTSDPANEFSAKEDFFFRPRFVVFKIWGVSFKENTVIPRLTSDPANEFFG